MSTSDLYAVTNYTNGIFTYTELLSVLSNQNITGQLAAFFKSSSNRNANAIMMYNLIKTNYAKTGLITIIWTGDPTGALTNILNTQSYSTGVNSMLAYAYADMKDYYAIEQYIADAQSYFSGLSSSGLEIANLVYHQDFALGEHHIYGSSRVGVRRYKGQTLFKRDFKITGINSDGTYNVNTSSVTNQVIAAASTDTFIYRSGITSYELTNHLGNVLATITDKKVPVTDNNNNILYYKAEVVTATDYYPFGMQMPERNYVATDECGYRFGFNGKESDNDIYGEGNSVDFGSRIYDPRLGRWMKIDPYFKSYVPISPYCFALNTPTILVDMDGNKVMDGDKEVIVTIDENTKTASYKLADGSAVSKNFMENGAVIINAMILTPLGQETVNEMIAMPTEISMSYDKDHNGPRGAFGDTKKDYPDNIIEVNGVKYYKKVTLTVYEKEIKNKDKRYGKYTVNIQEAINAVAVHEKKGHIDFVNDELDHDCPNCWTAETRGINYELEARKQYRELYEKDKDKIDNGWRVPYEVPNSDAKDFERKGKPAYYGVDTKTGETKTAPDTYNKGTGKYSPTR